MELEQTCQFYPLKVDVLTLYLSVNFLNFRKNIFLKTFILVVLSQNLFLVGCRTQTSTANLNSERSQSDSLESSDSCLNKIQLKVIERDLALAEKYLRIDPENGSISNFKKSIFTPGKKKGSAIILLHGFAASPFEVEEIAQHLNSAGSGFTVFSPLVEGFGSSAKVADVVSVAGDKPWTRTLVDSIAIMKTCFSKVSLVGFSLGGGVASEFLASKDYALSGSYNGVEIESAVILSPFIRLPNELFEWLAGQLAIYLENPNVDELWGNIRANDLLALVNHKKYFNEFIPLKAGRALGEYGKQLAQLDSNQKSSVPVLEIFSLADKSISFDAIEKFSSKHFENYKVSKIAKVHNIPHQIGLSDLEKLRLYGKDERLERMLQEIQAFVTSNLH